MHPRALLLGLGAALLALLGVLAQIAPHIHYIH
jgi:hypothetical protein